MWTLTSGCWNMMFQKKEFGVLLIGLEGSGKTTFLERLKTLYSAFPGLSPDKVVPTVGCNVGRLNLSNSKALVWDLGGKTSLRSIWDKYYADSKAVIYCVDVSDPVHWEESRTVLQQVLEATPGVPILVFCTKTDVPGSKQVEELSEFFKVNTMGENNAKRVRFFGGSSISEESSPKIREAIMWLEKQLELSVSF